MSEKEEERRRKSERAQQENLRKQRLVRHGKKKIQERGLPGGEPVTPGAAQEEGLSELAEDRLDSRCHWHRLLHPD